jgi:hypothetical protein
MEDMFPLFTVSLETGSCAPSIAGFFAQFEGFSGLRGANLVTFCQVLCRKSFSWHYSETAK